MTTWTQYRTKFDHKLDEYLGAPWESFEVAEVIEAMRTLGYTNEVNSFEAAFTNEEDSR